LSKPIPKEGIVHLPPDEQVRAFARLYRGAVGREALERFGACCGTLGLRFTEDELAVLAALDTPARLEHFLATELFYNDDHSSPEAEETAMPPRLVLRTGMAHCFEGAFLAYAVHFLHGHGPSLVMLEASQDADHNIVVWRDPHTGLFGSTAQSRYPGLVGRPAEYATIRDLAASYVPFYYSDRTLDPRDLTLVGFSDPIDMVAKYGTAWMASEEPLWDIYFTYIDDAVLFHYFADDPGRPHFYPVVRALKENWIRLDADGEPFVSLDDLPAEARRIWDAFWRAYGPGDGPRPRGRAREIEQAFFRSTGTTPIDLEDNANDLSSFLAAGHTLDQLIKR
jgi:hypothetical protein